jgi:hypothetical protein
LIDLSRITVKSAQRQEEVRLFGKRFECNDQRADCLRHASSRVQSDGVGVRVTRIVGCGRRGAAKLGDCQRRLACPGKRESKSVVKRWVIRDQLQSLLQRLPRLVFPPLQPIEVGQVRIGRCSSRSQTNRGTELLFRLGAPTQHSEKRSKSNPAFGTICRLSMARDVFVRTPDERRLRCGR